MLWRRAHEAFKKQDTESPQWTIAMARFQGTASVTETVKSSSGFFKHS